jgi:ABC-type nitrate/sulfonate/bicarbonate transport system ATPase subunit
MGVTTSERELVGRADELAEIEQRLEEGGIVLLQGEAGIGKSTLWSAAIEAPQEPQTAASAVPHSPQNPWVAALAAPQLGHMATCKEGRRRSTAGQEAPSR